MPYRLPAALSIILICTFGLLPGVARGEVDIVRPILDVLDGVGSRTGKVAYYKIAAGDALHLSVPRLNVTPENLADTFTWNFGDPSSSYNTLPGFNAAHVYNRPGAYRVTVNKAAVAQVAVVERAETPLVTDAAQMAQLLAAGGTARMGSGVYVVSRRITTAPGARLLGQPDGSTTLYWDGPPFDVVLDGLFGGLTVQDVAFDSRFNLTTDKDAPDAIRLGGKDNAVVGCRFYNTNYAVNGNGRPDGVLVQDNLVPGVTDLRGYFVWAEGRRWTILGNRVPNSTRESAIRLNAVGSNPDCDLVLLYGNTLANISRQDVDPYDTVKSALKLEAADHVLVQGNTFNGIVEAGPLGGPDGNKSSKELSEFIVFRDNVHNGPIRLKHGLSHFLMTASRVNYSANDIGGYVSALTCDAVDPAYDRRVSDVTLSNNLFVSIRRGERQMWVMGPVEDRLLLSRNRFIQGSDAPVGPGRATIAFEQGWQKSYASTDNLYPPGGSVGWPNPQSVMQVGTQNDPAAYYVPVQWMALPGVSGDSFVAAPIP